MLSEFRLDELPMCVKFHLWKKEIQTGKNTMEKPINRKARQRAFWPRPNATSKANALQHGRPGWECFCPAQNVRNTTGKQPVSTCFWNSRCAGVGKFVWRDGEAHYIFPKTLRRTCLCLGNLVSGECDMRQTQDTCRCCCWSDQLLLFCYCAGVDPGLWSENDMLRITGIQPFLPNPWYCQDASL